MYERTAESVSGFMRWAEARIAKEVEDNECLERTAGTRDFIPGSNCNRPTHRLSQEEKTEIINKIDTMRGTGVSLKTSVQQCGIHQSTYFLWKRTFNLPAYQSHKLTH
jgi:putative aminopeptidase FrvX